MNWRRCSALLMMALVVTPLVAGCKGEEPVKPPANSNYYTGKLAEKPKTTSPAGPMGGRGGAAGSGTER